MGVAIRVLFAVVGVVIAALLLFSQRFIFSSSPRGVYRLDRLTGKLCRALPEIITYRVTTSDGHVYEVEVPIDAPPKSAEEMRAAMAKEMDLGTATVTDFRDARILQLSCTR